MFFVEFASGDRKTEADLGDWDSVPRDKPLKVLGLQLPLVPLILKGYEQYYCGRLGVTPLGGIHTWLGYVLIGIKNGICIEIVARYDGIVTRHYPVEQLNVRPGTLRKGLTNGS